MSVGRQQGEMMRIRSDGRFFWRLPALALALAMVAAACAGTLSEETTTTTEAVTETTSAPESTTTEAMAQEGTLPPGTYKIGYVTLETGTLAFAGVPSVEAVNLFFDLVNEDEALGEGVVIEVVREDGGGDQGQAIAAADLLIANDEILGIICCTSSSITGAIKPLIDSAGVASVMVSAILPNATEGPYMFRPKPPSATLYEVLAPVGASAFEMETAVVTRTTDNDGMVETANIMAAELEAEGVEVTFVDLLSDDTDLSGAATQIIDLDPDGVFHAELASTLALHVRELVDRGYTGPQFGTGSTINPEQWEVGGQAMTGVGFALHYFPGAEDPGTKAFVAAWEEAQDDPVPPSYAAEGWAAAQTLYEGLKNAATISSGEAVTREQLVEGLSMVQTLSPSPFGDVFFDATGQGDIEAPVLLQWNCDGEVVLWDGTDAGLIDRTTC